MLPLWDQQWWRPDKDRPRARFIAEAIATHARIAHSEPPTLRSGATAARQSDRPAASAATAASGRFRTSGRRGAGTGRPTIPCARSSCGGPAATRDVGACAFADAVSRVPSLGSGLLLVARCRSQLEADQSSASTPVRAEGRLANTPELTRLLAGAPDLAYWRFWPLKQELHAKCSPRCRVRVFSSARWTAALPACQGPTRIPAGGQIIPRGRRWRGLGECSSAAPWTRWCAASLSVGVGGGRLANLALFRDPIVA
jgi:hypothetical protein